MNNFLSKVFTYYPKIIVEHTSRNLRYYQAKILHKKKLSPYYLSIYSMMLQDANYSPGKWWENLAKNMHKELISKGLSNVKRGYFNKHFVGRFPSGTLEHSALWQYYRNVKSKDRLKILDKVQEPDVGNPYKINLDGKKITWDFIQSIDEFYHIIDTFNIEVNDRLVICEIGGGYGRLAHLFLETMPRCHYVLVDIPTTLIIAYYYLHKVFAKDIYTYEESRKTDVYDKDVFMKKRLSFLVPNKFFKIEKSTVDLFINIDSFQEMTAEIVKQYLHRIKELKGNYLYIKNSKDPVHNLVDTKSFKLLDYPKHIGMNIIKSEPSTAYADMIEQFIKLN